MVTTTACASRVRRPFPNTVKAPRAAEVARPRGGFLTALLRALSAMAG